VKKFLPAIVAIVLAIVILKIVNGRKPGEPASLGAGSGRGEAASLGDTVDAAIADAVEEIAGDDA
jgi:hypothetical protein